MQNAFANENGSFAKHGRNISLMKRAIPVIKRAIDFCHENNMMVLYTRQINLPEFLSSGLHSFFGREVSEWFPADTYICLKGTWDAEIVNELTPTKKDVVIEKNKTSAFYDTWIELYLRHKKIRTIIITGSTTGMCVMHTTVEAFCRDFDALVVEDGVGDQDPYVHDAVLEVLDRRFGRVLQWGAIERALKGYPSTVKIAGYPLNPGIKILSSSQKTYLKKTR
jgi:ureidoacrylate peracid hydrolase